MPQPDMRTACGSLLFLVGRADAYEKYIETLVDFHRRGWNVSTIDWRGQAGSGRLSQSPLVGHVDRFSLWVHDIEDFWADWVAETDGPHVVVAHSMGGHLVCRAMAENRIHPDAAVLIAPMFGLKGLGLPDSVSHVIAKVMACIGRDDRAAWKVTSDPNSPVRMRQRLLTHDDERYLDEIYWWEQRPELMMGPASWRWIERAYNSTIQANAAGEWEKVETPCLILGAQQDKLVRFDAIEQVASRLPDARLVVFGPESRHEILRETDDVRARAFAEIDRFFGEKVAGGE